MLLKNLFALLLTACVLTWGCDTKTKNVDSCGDGFVDPGEQCDGSNLAGASCASLGFYDTEGVLACSDECTFVTTDCGVAQCGDGLIQEGFDEQCDGTELGGNSCQQLGYARGTLACLPSCRFDITGCERDGYCGDGTVDAPFEECEGTNLDGNTCMTVGFYQGTLRCNSNCWFDTTACNGTCGDGVIDTQFQEQCDGTNLNLQTCETLGYANGTLGCLPTCQWDFSNCPLCGNDVIDEPEVCDGTNFNGQTCVDLGFLWGGELTCNSSCSAVDTSLCRSSSTIVMISVPAGTFQRNGTPTNLSTVSAFQISQHEITRAQWVEVTGWADPSNTTCSSGTSDPVQMVSWYDAITFCNKLSLLEGLDPVYSVAGVNFFTLRYDQIPSSTTITWDEATANPAASGYRLPTEMEWMWAAMGADTANPGAVNTTGYAKAFAGSTGSNAVGDYAYYNGNSAGKTHPVGSKLPNDLGLYDMSGNVFEWVWDIYGSIPAGALTDYEGPASGTIRVMRGGRWYDDASYCTVAYRGLNGSCGRNYGNGFRVVRR